MKFPVWQKNWVPSNFASSAVVATAFSWRFIGTKGFVFAGVRAMNPVPGKDS
jgi:hypothetical protein